MTKSYLFTLLIISSILFYGCSVNVEKDPKKAEYTVSLPANSTTGFQWSIVEYDKSLFELINGQYLTSKIGVIGAGGTMIYTFKLLKQKHYPKTSKMKFKYARSWEPESAIYKEVTVNIE
ncbi:MAG: protease inhibitor I42 family protein [Legionellaceae bacterium]|nr:protease inhibitor I42 family protein [Legionellaceae bacterium]